MALNIAGGRCFHVLKCACCSAKNVAVLTMKCRNFGKFKYEFKNCSKIFCMDKIDRKILAELQRNARASLQEIGQAVGLSPSPCWARIKRMEENGVIEGYTVRINPQTLGFADTVLLMVTLNSHSDNTLEKFGEQLATIPEVVEAHLVSGTYDYLLRVVVRDTRDYERLLREKLYKIKGIQHSQSMFVLRTLKRTELPLGT